MSADLKRRSFVKGATITAFGISILPRHVLGKGFIPPSDQILIGIIGSGKQGRGIQNWLCNYPQVRIISASDVEVNKLNLLEKRLIEKYSRIRPLWKVRNIKKYSDYQELIEQKNLDATVISTPDHWHSKPCIEAMENDLDVYCEKPISHTIREGRLMVETALHKQRIFQTGSIQRSNKLFRHACELIRNGYLGAIKRIVVYVGDPSRPCDLPAEPTPPGIDWNAWQGPAPTRPFNAILSPPVEKDIFPRWRWFEEYGGGILADWGAHMFDIVQWALGTDHTTPITFVPTETPNALSGLRAYYKNGIEIEHSNQRILDDKHGIEFFGTEGNMTLARGTLITDPENIASAEIKESEKRLYKSEDHLLDWIKAIQNRKDPICPAEIGHRSASICHLFNIGYKLNSQLKWDPVKEKFKSNSVANKMRTKKYRRPFKI